MEILSSVSGLLSTVSIVISPKGCDHALLRPSVDVFLRKKSPKNFDLTGLSAPRRCIIAQEGPKAIPPVACYPLRCIINCPLRLGDNVRTRTFGIH